MKRTLRYLIAVGIALFSSSAYAQQLTFSYDAAGNQTKREWVCINCRPNGTGTIRDGSPLKLETKLLDTAKKVVIKRTITASPNPFLEHLNINWETEQGVSVKSIMVFNMNGAKTHELSPATNQNSVTLPFQNLAIGTYIVYVTFSDQRKESIKVIKK